MRCVIDTNVFVSAAMFPLSVPREAVRKAVRSEILLFSDDSFEGLQEVLFRARFDRYVSREDRTLFFSQLGRVAEFVRIVRFVHECRDPNDDKFLEVALNGQADLIITGDADLLALHPWRQIAIMTPGDYLKG